jgi:phosphatidylinositol alpha-1,6-mannosyltransferase
MTPNRRIHFSLLTDAFLPHAGGSRYYYYNLFKRIADLGNEVSVLTSKVKGWEAFDHKAQTDSFKIERHFKPLRDLSYSQLPKIMGPMLAAGAMFLRDRPDILHCGDLYPPGLIGVLLKRTSRLPFIAYSHGEEITQTDQRRFQPAIRNLVYKTADAIVANGSFAVQNLLRIGVSESKIHTITPGLDTSIFFPRTPNEELRQLYGITDELVVLTVARLTPRKGQSRVIAALAALGSKIPAVKYLIVGRGPEESALRAQVKHLGIEDKVIFAGFVPDDAINDHYNLSDILVMPNIKESGDVEGFGMVFLEANAVGLPVIGGKSGGTAEAIEDGVTGFLVDETSEEELRDRLILLLSDPALRTKMGHAGLERVRNEFSWDSRATYLRDISLDVIASSKKGA